MSKEAHCYFKMISLPTRSPPFCQVKSIGVPFFNCVGKKLQNCWSASSLFSFIRAATAATSPFRRCEPEVSLVGIRRMVLVNAPFCSAS